LDIEFIQEFDVKSSSIVILEDVFAEISFEDATNKLRNLKFDYEGFLIDIQEAEMKEINGKVKVNFNDITDTAEQLFHEFRKKLVDSSGGDLA